MLPPPQAIDAQIAPALSALRDVHLWLPQPSAQLWDDLAVVAAEGPVPREDDDSAEWQRKR